ncbi:MAG: dihydroxyacetone kinase subunit L [Odoribacter sp.]|nr:dihydroxyacetone kinase subunit L [Odoribacter sp.]
MSDFMTADAIKWMENLAATYEKNKDYLSELDREIGDSDHGINMARGFTAVNEKMSDMADKDIATVFKTVAMTLISTVGGASGPLYGTFFLQCSMKSTGKESMNVEDMAEAFKAGLGGIISRGKAGVGDKTMVDAMSPAVAVFDEAQGNNLTEVACQAKDAAKAGAESTKPLVARKGRASYLGDRSAGHLDPGAESTFMLFDELCNTLQSKK